MKNEIIEIGMISFSFSTDKGIWDVVGHYHSLNDPKSPISPKITKLTQIDHAMLAGQKIDWDLVLQFLQRSGFIICHNSEFDRKFFELQTPQNIREMVRSKPFACTYQDIDWKARGFDRGKLAFLNKKMGFPFVGHRAINDCWATLNLLLQNPTALNELTINMKKETVLGVTHASPEIEPLLIEWGYKKSSGINTRLPQGYWVCLPNEYVAAEKKWLNDILADVSIQEYDASLDRYAPTSKR